MVKNKGNLVSVGAWSKKKMFSVSSLKKLLFDPNYITPVCLLLFVGEIFLNLYIVGNVKYTEIDWIAYMQEVEGFLNGTLDYAELKGDTGPCVYPAGFLYLYSILYYLTSQGTNIRLAQYIFMGLYLAQTYLTYDIYRKTCKVPGYALILSAATSYRIHSIYVLRLFNDPFAVFFFYLSLHFLLDGKWKTASVIFSIAVSIKMNILLYAPALFIAYITNLSHLNTFINLAICGVIQLILGAPFLYTNPYSYLKASFDLGRVFEHKWTVNYRFLDVEIFENKVFHLSLLAVHLVLLGIFAKPIWRFMRSYANLRGLIVQMRNQTLKSSKKEKEKLEKEDELSADQQQFLDNLERQFKHRAGAVSKKQLKSETEEKVTINFYKISQLMILPFFVTNFIGIVCARSLHYQFYSWYFHSLLYLAFSTKYSKPFTFLLLALIEYSWNTYPSTNASSSILHICHVSILLGVYSTMTA
ncbi:PREDICTED: lethal(2)neighbour of tid protein [Nicrophorus vespilloides]|uniref:dolichyl-P-Man:Man5GlcNAc2-PP-dolichol alpha-1,3-mannosyltransferase n=1 Tax=Nicrophorus vespilloides TaxID=110193 RepID=A0ABM1MAH5_NICVS|nr:PREDICTED: lethal(2)neighbour of tid protein [Nicrophorus vespilloides]